MAWQPGQSGNPKGPIPVIPEEIRAMIKKGREDVVTSIFKIFSMSFSDLVKFTDDSNLKNLTALEAGLAKIWVQVINTGDSKKAQFLFSYSVGEAVKHLEVTNPDGSLGTTNHAAIFMALEEYRKKHTLETEDANEEG